MGLDLNNPLDFAKATMSTLSNAAGLLQFITGRPKNEWDIHEASYISDDSAVPGAFPIVFHVFESKQNWEGALSQISSEGGRRKVFYKYPYKDGQTSDDLGREPETFSLDVVLFGQGYLEGYQKLMTELHKPTVGTLNHPVRGNIRCVLHSYSETFKSDERKAVTLKLVFKEHNFNGISFTDFQVPEAKSALTKALEMFGKISSVITQVQAKILFVQSLKTLLTRDLEDYQNKYGDTLVKMNLTFNPAEKDFPLLLPVNEGGVRLPDGSYTSNTFPISDTDPFANVPVDKLSGETATAIAIQQLTKEVNQLRIDVDAIINTIKNGASGVGALEFHDEILILKQSAVDLQDALEKGAASSNAQVIDFEVPRDMSIREIAFTNRIDLARVEEIDLLNPQLDSVNYVPRGTIIKVPTS